MVKIQQNEVLLHDQEQWLYFHNPYKLIIADTLDQVIPALAEIEYLVERNQWHAAGFISYESGPAFDPALPTKPVAGFPYLWFGLYPQPEPVNLPSSGQTDQALNWFPSVERTSYTAAITKIKEYIAQGKTYQVNYTLRLQADFQASAWDFFLQLAQHQNKYAAYIDTGRYAICSASPELFFELENQTITCRPMKGTVKRGRTTREDAKQSEWLKNSEKNRAENIMIVDMIRNDLGRIAKTGSVRVPELFCTERYPTLWQMTSTVTAQTDKSVTEIFRALFPCASITGAPKVSTMKIIDELETAPRKIYTGALGCIFSKRKAKFNVAIRTVLLDKEAQQAEYGVGGGIVWDSTSTDEYMEALLKAQLLRESQPEFSLLETMLWAPESGFFLRERHIARLLDSANYFDIPTSRAAVEELLHLAAAAFDSPQRVRLLLDKAGNIKIESSLYQPAEKVVHAHLAQRAIESDNVFLFHKTTCREVYENARAGFPDADDILLYNKRGELTEFTIGNLVVELNGQLITPPVECGLLPGTFRAYLLETGQIMEGILSTQQLQDCTKIFRVNSLRTWEVVHMRWE